MEKKSITAKVRPVAQPLEKASLSGAARIYVSRESLQTLTNEVRSGQLCVIEKLSDDGAVAVRRQASLWTPEKNVNPNVVLMTRVFQEASGFQIGDQVSIEMLGNMPDAQEISVQNMSEDQDEVVLKNSISWEGNLGLYMDRAGLIFPGMVFESIGFSFSKLRPTFKVISVNGKKDNVAKFDLSTSIIQIKESNDGNGSDSSSSRPLVLTGVPGLSSSVATINKFFKPFTRPFWYPNERKSCGLVIHGGRGMGKTFILKRIAEIGWGKPFWITPSTINLSAIRATFQQARVQQPSIVLIDGLEKLIAKERSNREAVIEFIAEELDILSSEIHLTQAMPKIIVIATCQDYVEDMPLELQKESRLLRNVGLSVPCVADRREILAYCDPPLHPNDRAACLESMAQRTHAYTPRDLSILVGCAVNVSSERLDQEYEQQPQSPSPDGSLTEKRQHFLSSDDIGRALAITQPTVMHGVKLQPPTIHFQDIGGQEKVKKVLKRMLSYTKGSDVRSRAVQPRPPKGLLLFGPPGCSKTLSAQAAATESGFNFFSIKGAELLNMFVGETERATRMLFQRARNASPSIIFFDEIDSIGQLTSRTHGIGGGGVNVLTTLLTEMDGFETLKGVLVIAATNRPQILDPALLRAGRFHKKLYVGPPDQTAREAVFNIHLRELNLAQDVNIGELSTETEGFSGAEIQAVCIEAGEKAMERLESESMGDSADAAKTGPEIKRIDLLEAIKETHTSITDEMIDEFHKWAKIKH